MLPSLAFFQQPLPAAKKATLVQSLGSESVKLGQADSDARVRQMIALLMSSSEYQLE